MYNFTQNTKANLPHLSQYYESVWDKHPIHSQVGGWVADRSTGELKYKLDKFDWKYKIDGTLAELTGANGDVMVKVPAFYVKYLGNGKWELDDTIPNKRGTNCKPGFFIHPAFKMKSGRIKKYILVAAYKASIIDGQLRSVSGVKPAVSRTIAAFTDAARQGRNTGKNHHDITRFYERLAINMLIYFEFGTLNGQAVMGDGWSTGNTESNITGTTNALGDRSGYLGATNGKASIRWRGIEDYWGNVWEFVTGFMISDIGYWFTNDPSKFLKMTEMEHYPKNLSSKVTNGYITAMEQIPGKEFLWIPSATGGGATTYWCDYFWSHDPTEENIALAGGIWHDGASCGPACWHCGYFASVSYSNCGARLSCSEEEEVAAA